MRKLVCADDFSAYRERFAEKLSGWEIAEVLDEDKFPAALADAEILLGWGGAKKAIENARSLKWIQLFSAGVDAMPFGLLKERGIYLTTASGVHANPISETIFAMMLGFCRRLFVLRDNQLKGIWSRSHAAAMTELHGKTIGILGAGSIGSETAHIARAFGMRVLGLRRSGGTQKGYDKMFGPDGLCEMLGRSDYVVNILPATKDTAGLVGDAEFKAMKPSAVYISVGRGKTTDTEALINALQNGVIAAAGLDVTDPEPLPESSPLWAMENVIIGAHTAGGTESYMERAMEIFFQNLDDYLAGKAPGRNLVDYDLQY